MESFIWKACGEEVLNEADIVAIDNEIYYEPWYPAMLHSSAGILGCEKCGGNVATYYNNSAVYLCDSCF